MKQLFPCTYSSITHPQWAEATWISKINEGWKSGVYLTVSWSCCCSKNAENSNIQSLELATLRPCQAGTDGEGERPAGDSNPKYTRFMYQNLEIDKLVITFQKSTCCQSSLITFSSNFIMQKYHSQFVCCFSIHMYSKWLFSHPLLRQ